LFQTSGNFLMGYVFSIVQTNGMKVAKEGKSLPSCLAVKAEVGG